MRDPAAGHTPDKHVSFNASTADAVTKEPSTKGEKKKSKKNKIKEMDKKLEHFPTH
jgi:hypothetical protein